MSKFRLIAILFPVIAAATLSAAPKVVTVKSPDGGMSMKISLSDSIRYSVDKGGETVIPKVAIALHPAGGKVLGIQPKLKKTKRESVRETIAPVIPLKYSTIANDYNSVVMQFDGGYSVEFRVFDTGVAHRFVTSLPGQVDIVSEDYNVTLPEGIIAHIQQPGGFKTAYEEAYSHKSLADWNEGDRMATFPALMEMKDGNLMLFSESDVCDYPRMFLKGTGTGFFSVFPKVPLAFGEDGDRSVKILREADYIARTDGTRNFPWRYVAVGTPSDIVCQTLNCQLSASSAIGDTSWIKPGKASWEWWNGATPYGEDVDFESGFNLNTYKYFIDFAARYDIPYIIMDEGWAMSTRDPYTPNPDVNVHEIVRYGKEKGVGVFLWLTWLTVENNFELFKTFSDWGVAGLKIDFMDRSDQWMVNFYERVCKEAAANKLMVDMHGSFTPAGLEHKYPNLVSYEGVRGMEQMGGCQPDNSVYFPFIRNAVGPMDYTPGAMISMQPECYRAERPNSASVGTRAYQMALFVVFESGMQMLADNPTLYYRNHDCTEFIASVPVTWDETRVLEAATGKYLVVAKRKGDKWYIGGIANGSEKYRDFSINLDFLSNGKYSMTSFEDGINAARQAMDYRRKVSVVDNATTVTVRIVRNGGWAAVISPENGN